MKELTELLERLAATLGTTVERLWVVLLKQAIFSGIVDLATCIGFVVFSVWAFRFVNEKTTKRKRSNNEYARTEADWEDEGAVFAWLSVGVLFIVTTIYLSVSIEMIVAAFFNPEYWALMKASQHIVK